MTELLELLPRIKHHLQECIDLKWKEQRHYDHEIISLINQIELIELIQPEVN